MGKLKFALACAPYDRTHALMDGTIVPEGIELNFIPLEVEEIFWRQLRHQEFDGSEMSFSSYTMARSRGDDSLIAIPVFTSRFFRHSCVYINVHKGIGGPGDLKGKTVGVPEYQLTALVWMRGIFQHEYGVFPRDIHWRSGGQETPGREEKLAFQAPADVDYKPIPHDKVLSDVLDKGEIDALFTPRTPSCFLRGCSQCQAFVRELRGGRKAYYLKTRIFPIMHVIVIKKAVYEANKWAAMSLYKAFSASKNLTLQNMRHTFALYSSLPWLISYVDETRTLMGEDWWPYGIEKNRQTLEALCAYSYEQGLSQRHMKIESSSRRRRSTSSKSDFRGPLRGTGDKVPGPKVFPKRDRRTYMTGVTGIPRGAAVAVDDMLEHCAMIKAGQEVLILAQIDGLYGGDNLVDEQAISWIQAAVQHRGANASVLWIDEPARPHAWRIPPVVKAALKGCDVLINHSFDLVVEEIMEFRNLHLRAWFHHGPQLRDNGAPSLYALGADTPRARRRNPVSGVPPLQGGRLVAVNSREWDQSGRHCRGFGQSPVSRLYHSPPRSRRLSAVSRMGNSPNRGNAHFRPCGDRQDAQLVVPLYRHPALFHRADQALRRGLSHRWNRRGL